LALSPYAPPTHDIDPLSLHDALPISHPNPDIRDRRTCRRPTMVAFSVPENYRIAPILRGIHGPIMNTVKQAMMPDEKGQAPCRSILVSTARPRTAGFVACAGASRKRQASTHFGYDSDSSLRRSSSRESRS